MSMTGENCQIADSAHLSPNCFIGNDVIIGENVIIHPGAYIGDGTVIEENVIIGPNAVIGHYAFYYKKKPTGYDRMHSCGFVYLEKNVEIGAGSTIDAGVSAITRVGEGTKIDNLVQIGHNVRIGAHTAMAGCVGVPTARVDTLAFAIGSGVAGLGGLALSQIANVGPAMGTGYIVDAFMVVVLGGVGQLAGAVWAALGLGIVAKFLEGWAGAVVAKILVLVFIIAFIQKRPQGIFALKGRFADS